METPSLNVLRPLQFGEILPNVGLLEAIAKANWNDRLTKDDLVNELREQRVSAWRIEGVQSGLVLIRVEQSPTRRVLILDGLAGHNVLAKGQAIGQDLETLARWFQCGSIETAAHDLRWNFVAKRLGFSPVSVIYERKL